jgi:multidrug efflux pump subunit AcrA (membrane-fusion protein)
MARTVEAVGSLTGFDETQLSAKVDGRVKRVFVDVGDSVVPGAPLLEIDPTDYILAESEAARALEAELARLGLKEIPSGKLDVSQVPAVKRAMAASEDAKRKLKQKEDLRKQNAGSEDEVELARTELKLAEATVHQMETEAEATLAVAKLRLATYQQAKQRVADCIVTAPVPETYAAWAAVLGAGFTPAQFAVSARLVTEGEMLRSMPVTPVIRLVLDSALKVRVTVPENAQSQVALGQSVDVYVDAYPKNIFPGIVSRISPTVDPQARTLAVEVIVPNANRKLKAGSFARAVIKTRLENNVMVVPGQAVVSYAGVSKVFVLDGPEKAKAVLVEVTPRDGETVEVRGALKPGDKVLVSGLTQVVDGSAVRVKE